MISNNSDILGNEPFAALTSFDVGGPARYLVRVSSEEDAASALAFAGERGLEPIALCGGSRVKSSFYLDIIFHKCPYGNLCFPSVSRDHSTTLCVC